MCRPNHLTRKSSATAGGIECRLKWTYFHKCRGVSERPAVSCSDWLDGLRRCWSPLHNDPLSPIFGERKCLRQSNLARLSAIQVGHAQVVIAKIVPPGLRA